MAQNTSIFWTHIVGIRNTGHPFCHQRNLAGQVGLSGRTQPRTQPRLRICPRVGAVRVGHVSEFACWPRPNLPWRCYLDSRMVGPRNQEHHCGMKVLTTEDRMRRKALRREGWLAPVIQQGANRAPSLLYRWRWSTVRMTMCRPHRRLSPRLP